MMLKLSIILIVVGQINGFFRLPCDDPLTIERVDPLMNPGTIGGHVHTVNGGSNFSPSATFASLRASTCSSCSVLEDMSAYWTPQLYMEMADGTFKSVQQTGGSLIYYLFRFNSADTGPILAFPSGLKMVVGNPTARTYVDSLTSRAIGWNCLGSVGTSRTPNLPLTNCPNGLRGEIMFPSCWNGKDLDSTDHISHMAYPIGGESGPCPPGFPNRIVTLFYETLWSVDPMNSLRSQAKNPSQPFVLANGDPTGFSYHGDFMDAWTPGVLQQAVNNCTASDGVIEECSILHLTNQATNGRCQKTPDVNEEVLGTLPSLPGCNLVSATGPSSSSMCPNYVAPQIFDRPVGYLGEAAPPGSQVLPSTPKVVLAYKNYTYVDCYSDNAPVRALKIQLTTASKTVEACLDAALAIEAKYVGIEYFGECWIDNTLASNSLPVGPGQCFTPCTDSPLQICGGYSNMDLYILGSTIATVPTTIVSTPQLINLLPPVLASYAGYNHIGCFSDNGGTRSLLTRLPSSGSIQSCIDIAKSSGYSSAGLEYGGECWAGWSLSQASVLIATSSCSMSCGTPAQSCGGPDAIDYYHFAGILTNEPITVLSYKTWNFVSCQQEAISGRALAHRLSTSSATVEACLDAATLAGFTMAGLEYYGECWADNEIAITSAPSPYGKQACQTLCSDNKNEFCGGFTREFDYYVSTPSSSSSKKRRMFST